MPTACCEIAACISISVAPFRLNRLQTEPDSAAASGFGDNFRKRIRMKLGESAFRRSSYDPRLFSSLRRSYRFCCFRRPRRSPGKSIFRSAKICATSSPSIWILGFWNKFLVTHNKRLVQALSGLWIVSLMALAGAGAIWGCVANEDDAMMAMMIYLGMVVAHAISFATELYAIAKLPLIILGFALLVRRLQALSRHGAALARLTAAGAAGLGLLVSALAVA
jgi:hypothetical protein